MTFWTPVRKKSPTKPLQVANTMSYSGDFPKGIWYPTRGNPTCMEITLMKGNLLRIISSVSGLKSPKLCSRITLGRNCSMAAKASDNRRSFPSRVSPESRSQAACNCGTSYKMSRVGNPIRFKLNASPPVNGRWKESRNSCCSRKPCDSSPGFSS